MAGIFQHVRPYDLFDSTTLTILDQAYDRALASIENRKNTIAVREFDCRSHVGSGIEGRARSRSFMPARGWRNCLAGLPSDRPDRWEWRFWLGAYKTPPYRARSGGRDRRGSPAPCVHIPQRCR